MIITVASGKGGTGKTTFAVNLAYALAPGPTEVRLLDCDVEEPNDHLFVRPTQLESTPVKIGKPVWDREKCTACGKCAEGCAYNALALVKEEVLFFNELCHGCGLCSYVCPTGAMREEPFVMGRVEVSANPKPFFFAHGILNLGEPLAPAVVRAVKEHIADEAINIIDAAPGTACPVVEAIEGADIAVLVTEPTPFGLHDLKLAVGLALKLRVPTGIVVNRSDGTDELITNYAKEAGLPILGRIPFRRAYAEAYSRGDILTETFPELTVNLLNIHAAIEKLAGTEPLPPPPEEQPLLPREQRDSLPKGSSPDYREVVVISGKGGTGKTTVTASLAVLAREKVLADNDVDAADLHLLLKPIPFEKKDFRGGRKAEIDPAQCTGCGACKQYCHFDAIRAEPSADGTTVYRIDELACEGCGLCLQVCPVDAITLTEQVTGVAYASDTAYGPMAHARLGIAQENTGKLVSNVRARAADLASELQYGLILADGPPGTSCPVIASITGTDLVLIVTEPTVSGVHDLGRVLELTRHFGVPARVIINKADLNEAQADNIRRMSKEAGADVIGEIPFDRNVHEALMAGKTLIEWGLGPASEAVHRVWAALENELAQS